MSWILALILVLLIGALYFSYRYAWWAPAEDYRYPRILMYHMISPPRRGARFNGLRVSPHRFERQLAWCRDQGWTFMTMAELAASKGQCPRKTVVLTFDDGYADNYLHALPLMQRYGAKGTLYLVADRHDRDWSTYKKAHHNSGELRDEPKLSDEQVQTMLDSGCFELGGHTFTHANLSRLSEKEREREIGASRIHLERLYGMPVTSFAYPFGIYTAADVSAAEVAGYTNAVTTIDGIETDFAQRPFEVRRVKISGKDNFLAFRIRMRRGKRGIKK